MKKTVKAPNGVIYWIVCHILFPFFRLKYDMRIDREGMDGLQQPFVILSNHVSNIDFLVAALVAWPYKINMVAAAMFFRNRILRVLLRMMGCISKEQFTADATAIRGMIQVLRQGGCIGIFPAGQSSFTGEATYIDPGIAKLLKWMKAPVVAIHMQGGHIAFPKWNMKRLRPSRIDTSIKLLYTPEQITSYSTQTIYDGIVDALYFDDYEWQRKRRIAAKKPRIAEGLEQMLVLCPNCKCEYTIQTRKNRVYCTACGNAAQMDEYGFLQPEKGAEIFDTPTAWNRWQYNWYRASLSESFVMRENVSVHRIMKHNGKRMPVGQGIAMLEKQAFVFEGVCDGKQVRWQIPNELAPIFPYEQKGRLDIAVEGQLYSISPENVRSVYKFNILKELCYRVLNEQRDNAITHVNRDEN